MLGQRNNLVEWDRDDDEADDEWGGEIILFHLKMVLKMVLLTSKYNKEDQK